MSGSLTNARRKPCSPASSSIEEPGSVTATKWAPSGWRPWKYSNSVRVSIVPPDLVETTNNVRPRSTASRTRAISSGSVESRTWSRRPGRASGCSE
jgi:hypothetical protein